MKKKKQQKLTEIRNKKIDDRFLVKCIDMDEFQWKNYRKWRKKT